MPAYTHPALLCWVCGLNRASRVIEAKVLPQFATDVVEVESYYQMSCASAACLSMSEDWADARDSVHVATRLLTRSEAQAISGRHLEEAS